MEKQQELLDQFAQSALNALIAKMPFYDVKGEYGKQIPSDELRLIKEGVTATAYEYASLMMIARENQKEWIAANVENNPQFGL
ncbi:hypothetical protein HZP59_08730 [Elizabethkingia anophelis]|nr:hypothetical protein [Elizabethkingia anophelis]